MKQPKSEHIAKRVHLPTIRRRTLRTDGFDIYEHRFYRNLCEKGSVCIIFFEIDSPEAKDLNRAVYEAAERFCTELQRRPDASDVSEFFSITAVIDETKKDALKVVCEHKRGNPFKTETRRVLHLSLETKNFRFCRRRDLTKKPKNSIL